MILTPVVVDEIRQIVQDGHYGSLQSIIMDGVTLGGALDFACAIWQWQQLNDVAALQFSKSTLKNQTILSQVWQAVISPQPVAAPKDPFSAREWEIYSVRQPEHITCSEYVMFRSRFEKSLRENGFAAVLARSASKALAEMADNIVQHSSTDVGRVAPGVVAWHTRPGWFTFGVADVGRGVLASLQDNPMSGHIQDSRDALYATVLHAATRRRFAQQGDGFRQLHAWLADLNGRLRFRSGNAILTLEGDANSRKARDMHCAELGGLQLSVVCALSRPTDYAL